MLAGKVARKVGEGGSGGDWKVGKKGFSGGEEEEEEEMEENGSLGCCCCGLGWV